FASTPRPTCSVTSPRRSSTPTRMWPAPPTTRITKTTRTQRTPRTRSPRLTTRTRDPSPAGRTDPAPRATPSMRLAGAELLESREILPGQWLQTYHAPELVAGARAGQFVHVRTGDFSGLVLRR